MINYFTELKSILAATYIASYFLIVIYLPIAIYKD